jgi:hypothetical protein
MGGAVEDRRILGGGGYRPVGRWDGGWGGPGGEAEPETRRRRGRNVKEEDGGARAP